MHTEKIDVNDTSTEKVIHRPLALCIYFRTHLIIGVLVLHRQRVPSSDQHHRSSLKPSTINQNFITAQLQHN